MNQSFEYDPAHVLGVSGGSTLEQIREAFRAKTKKHHPDLGGDEWAFRLVNQAYEALGQARVANYLRDPEPTATAPVVPFRPAQKADGDGVSIRRGVRDSGVDVGLLVDVESLILRLEFENPYEVLTTSINDRNLSCSLNLNWPSTLVEAGVSRSGDSMSAAEILSKIDSAFKQVVAQVEERSSWQHVEEGRYSGLLGFQSARSTSQAFMILRAELKSSGLGVNQWTRELVIPRDREAPTAGS